jgi:hypothetical protein
MNFKPIESFYFSLHLISIDKSIRKFKNFKIIINRWKIDTFCIQSGVHQLFYNYHRLCSRLNVFTLFKRVDTLKDKIFWEKNELFYSFLSNLSLLTLTLLLKYSQHTLTLHYFIFSLSWQQHNVRRAMKKQAHLFVEDVKMIFVFII